MSLNKKDMEQVAFLQTPLNTKRFKKVRQLVLLLLTITIAAAVVMAYHFISVK